MNAAFLREAIRLSIEKMVANEGGPFGAVIVRDGQIIGRGWNQVKSTNDPNAHAEVVAIRAAASAWGRRRLPDCTLVVTLSPCAMCPQARMPARIGRPLPGAWAPTATVTRQVAAFVPPTRARPRCGAGRMPRSARRATLAFAIAPANRSPP